MQETVYLLRLGKNLDFVRILRILKFEVHL